MNASDRSVLCSKTAQAPKAAVHVTCFKGPDTHNSASFSVGSVGHHAVKAAQLGTSGNTDDATDQLADKRRSGREEKSRAEGHGTQAGKRALRVLALKSQLS